MKLGEQTYMMSKGKITRKLADKQTIQVKVSLEITTQWHRDDLPEWKLRHSWSGAESQSDPRIALIGHTESPSCCPPMRRSTSHYMMPLRSATKPLQGWGTHPQLNWRLSPIPQAPAAFLTPDSLDKLFYLPVSPQALEEIRSIQNQTAHIVLDNSKSDKWSYCWGSDNYTSSMFYKYCFRDHVPHQGFKWI